MTTHRPLLMGRNGAVGANHPMATQAGLDVLRAGGNAADAAVAVSLALGVCEPAMSGLGGDGFYHYLDAATGISTVFNGSGPAPASARLENYSGGVPPYGPLSASMPGALGGVARLHSAAGTLPWAALVEPAIRLAHDGFAATRRQCALAADAESRLRADGRSAGTFCGKRPAELIVQPDLARTLERIAEAGAEDFYRGELARRIAAGLAEIGAAITAEDLASFEPEVTAPIAVSYRGFEVRQTPPNSTGFTMLQMLKVVEQADFARLAPADQIHLTVEAKKLAFEDRDRYATDPRFAPVPLDRLLSEAHARDLFARIDMRRAAHRPIGFERPDGDTTYFCVVDRHGNAVSGMQSLASAFGSGRIAGDTGILMNNRLSWWDNLPGHVNSMLPGKRISHTMNAPLVFRDGALWAVLGTPGADNQVQINTQVLTALIDLGEDPQQAAERARWTSSQPGQSAMWRGEGHGKLGIEADHGPDVLAELERRGHALNVLPHLGGPCAVQVIRVMPNGVRAVGSDPRRDGWAGAY